MTRTGFRVAAFGIAVLAALDPSLTSSRRTRPFVAIDGGSGEIALAGAVADAIDRRFTVVRGRSDLASATVLLGMPDESNLPGGPTFAVVRRPAITALRITRLDVPRRVLANSRIPVDVMMAVTGADGQSVTVELWEGETRVAQETARVQGDSSATVVRMSYVPTATARPLRAIARINGSAALDSAFTHTRVGDGRLTVLFFDARPSWNSTFVRRALEVDSRFSVVHRIQTSRGLANTAGQAPLSLRDAESLHDFAVIVVGAPDLLTAPDVNGLEAFMRRRGGRVVLMMEGRANGVIDRLTGASNWRVAQSTAPFQIKDATGRQILRARDLLWPGALPSNAATLASDVGRDSSVRTVIWSVPVGAGRLVVSGARDAWHYRADTSGFEAFWRSAITENAMQSPEPIEVQVLPRVVKPGGEVTVRVAVRDVFLSEERRRSARVAATMISSGDSTVVRLWPERTPGVFTGNFVAPRDTGRSRLVVEAATETTEVPFVVDTAAAHPRPDERAILESFVSSRGGRVVEDKDLASLPDLIASAVQSVSRVETWHPMRSPWWILPFVALLGAEWWWRRRHGMA